MQAAVPSCRFGAAKKSPKISKITAFEYRLIKLPDIASGDAKSVG